MQKAVFTVKTSKDNDFAIQFRPRITVLNMQKRNASLNRRLNIKMRESPNANANLTEFVRLRDVVRHIWRYSLFTIFYFIFIFNVRIWPRFKTILINCIKFFMIKKIINQLLQKIHYYVFFFKTQ